jgi:hypothetical protein
MLAKSIRRRTIAITLLLSFIGAPRRNQTTARASLRENDSRQDATQKASPLHPPLSVNITGHINLKAFGYRKNEQGKVKTDPMLAQITLRLRVVPFKIEFCRQWLSKMKPQLSMRSIYRNPAPSSTKTHPSPIAHVGARG